MLNETIKSGDWKGEKHVPVIKVKEAKAGEPVKVRVSIGDEIPHPNTFEHHIAWIKVFFKPEKGAAPVEVASTQLSAHGELGVFTEPALKFKFTPEGNGTLYALSYCNIHGLWQSEEKIELA
ncbi:MAG: superoxide reductase [Tissierellia bacterium]|nr:superoxide reductase [Tissierellia bacterium]